MGSDFASPKDNLRQSFNCIFLLDGVELDILSKNIWFTNVACILLCNSQLKPQVSS